MKTKDEAERYCSSKGGFLATAISTSSTKYDSLVSAIQNYYYYIALFNFTGTWKWTNDVTLTRPIDTLINSKNYYLLLKWLCNTLHKFYSFTFNLILSW